MLRTAHGRSGTPVGVSCSRRSDHDPTFTMALNSLAEDRLIAHNQLGRIESGTTKKRLLWGVNDNPDQTDGPGSPDEEA